MNVYLDGTPVSGHEGSIARAIVAASDAAGREGRVIIEVSADGGPIDQGLLESPPQDHAGIGELRFVSAPLGAFVKTTLLDALPVLDGIVSDAGEAADLIQRGETENAFEPLERVRQAWAIIHELVDKSRELLGERAVGESARAEAERGLASSLAEIKRAVGEQDWGGLSDELAYETPARVDTWRTLVEELAERAGR